MPIVPPHSPPKPAGPGNMRISLEYVGFSNAPTRREYRFRARSGSEEREYTIWIAHTAFAARHALLQDGPDICYQKLQRQMAELGLADWTDAGVTDGDLASYREAHGPPARRSFSPRPITLTPGQEDGATPHRRNERA